MHPSVSAHFPPGLRARGAAEVAAALAARRALLGRGAYLEVRDVVVVAPAAAAAAATAGGGAAASAAASTAASAMVGALAVAACAQVVPSRLLRGAPGVAAEARVPTAVALALGPTDAGEAAVVALDVRFSLTAAALPHLAPPPPRVADALAAATGAALRALERVGWAAGVAGDAWVAAAAAYRAGGAVGGSVAGRGAQLALKAAEAAWEVAKARVLEAAPGVSAH